MHSIITFFFFNQLRTSSFEHAFIDWKAKHDGQAYFRCVQASYGKVTVPSQALQYVYITYHTQLPVVLTTLFRLILVYDLFYVITNVIFQFLLSDWGHLPLNLFFSSVNSSTNES